MGRNSTIATAFAALSLAGALLFSAGASAATTCDRVASPAGSDSAAGTEAAPFLTAQRLADSLSDGQTGCLRAGTFSQDELKVTSPGITLSSYPGENATLKGRLWVAADGVTVENMSLDGRNPRNVPSPVTNASHDTFSHLDVTNYHTEICFKIGDATYGRAVGTVIEDSRIHDCGKLPSGNQDHGIYVGQADGTIIRDNWIYDNTDRGIQLFPDARDSLVTHNIIDGNGEGVSIGGDGNTASSGNVVTDNVISNSKLRWNIESWWAGGVEGSGNSFSDNCVFSSNSEPYYNTAGGILPAADGASGFTASGNRVLNPKFVNSGANDYALQSSSPCAWVQDGGPAPGVDTSTPPVDTPPADPAPVVTAPADPAPVVTSPSTDPPATDPVVTLDTSTPSVPSGGTVVLTGTATPTGSPIVKIEVRGHGVRVSHTRIHLRPDGSFSTRARVRVRHGARHVRLRAHVRGAGFSRAVSLSVR